MKLVIFSVEVLVFFNPLNKAKFQEQDNIFQSFQNLMKSFAFLAISAPCLEMLLPIGLCVCVHICLLQIFVCAYLYLGGCVAKEL